jgi:hypothetical protein
LRFIFYSQKCNTHRQKNQSNGAQPAASPVFLQNKTGGIGRKVKTDAACIELFLRGKRGLVVCRFPACWPRMG